MVVGAFPVVKLAVLAFKQLSKPIANILKERAKNHPFFRKNICMPPAQFYNWVEVKTKMWALNLGKPVKVPQLNETMAVELGANLLGEAIIYSIGAGLLIFEYRRQSNKETLREEQILEEKQQIQLTLTELALNIERQDAQIRHLTRTIADLESRSWIKKINILSSNKDDDSGSTLKADENSNFNVSNSRTSNTTGNYNPENGLLFKSLNLIENEVFYSDQASKSSGHSVVPEALKYLKFN